MKKLIKSIQFIFIISACAVVGFAGVKKMIDQDISVSKSSSSMPINSGIDLGNNQFLSYENNDVITYSYNHTSALNFTVTADVELIDLTFNNLDIRFIPMYVEPTNRFIKVNYSTVETSHTTLIDFSITFLTNEKLPSNLYVSLVSLQTAVRPGFRILVQQEQIGSNINF